MNFLELRQAVIDYMENTEELFVANIPLFIREAEKRIFNTVEVPVIRRNVMGQLTAHNKYLSCPLDFLSSYSLAVIDTLGSYSYLLNKDTNFMREAYPNPLVYGQPKYYAIFGPSITDLNELSFIVAPTPDINYSVELHYFYYPESITESISGTSFLGDNFDPILLYGALREAAVFMKAEADMVGYYETKYTEALGQLKRLGDGLEKQDAYRSGTYRVPVS
jgi:hypothetical protein